MIYGTIPSSQGWAVGSHSYLNFYACFSKPLQQAVCVRESLYCFYMYTILSLLSIAASSFTIIIALLYPFLTLSYAGLVYTLSPRTLYIQSRQLVFRAPLLYISICFHEFLLHNNGLLLSVFTGITRLDNNKIVGDVAFDEVIIANIMYNLYMTLYIQTV